MAITIDWGTRIINVPRADLQLVQAVPTEVRQLDIDAFRQTLNDLQDDPVGMAYPTTHQHVQPITVGGVTLARVVEIINGYTVTFEDGQYAVNLVGANSNIGDVTNVNQVSIRSANSAGLTFSSVINDQAYFGATVFINTIVGLPGTQFPRGTPTDPVDSLSDALIIASSRNFLRYNLTGTLTIGNSITAPRTVWTGDSINNAEIIFDGADVDQAVVKGMIIGGDMAGSVISAEECRLDALTDFAGKLTLCFLRSTIDVSATATADIQLYRCASNIVGLGKPIIDFSLATVGGDVRDYYGGLEIHGVTNGQSLSFDMSSGTLVFDSSCTNGSAVVRGVVELIDNSGPGFTVVTSGTVTELSAAGTITEQDKDDIAARIIPQIWAAND